MSPTSRLERALNLYSLVALGDAVAFPGTCVTGHDLAHLAVQERADGDELSRIFRDTFAAPEADTTLVFDDVDDVAADPVMVGCSDCCGSGQGRGGEHSRCRTCKGKGEVVSQVWS